MEDLQGTPEQLAHPVQAQQPAKPSCDGPVRQIFELPLWLIPQVFLFEGTTCWGSTHVSFRAAHVVCSRDCSLLKSSLSCFSTTGNKNIKVDLLEWVILRTTLKRLTIIESSLPAFSKITEIKLGIFPFFSFISSLKTWTQVPDTKQLA